MNFFCVYLLLCFLGTIRGDLVESQDANYTGCQLLFVKPETENDYKFFVDLYATKTSGLDFWENPDKDNASIPIQLCPNIDEKLEEQIKNFTYSVYIEDIQKVIDEQSEENDLLGRFDPSTENLDEFALDQYHTLQEIQDFYKIAVEEYPEYLTLENIGTTVKGHPLQVLKLSDGSTNKTKDVIWVDAEIHSREWITSASLIFVIKQMLTANDTSIKDLLRDFDWHFLPIANPDGYEYTWKKDRLWRKNRSNNLLCVGVDLNRNFDINFRGGGFSTNFFCSQEYKGAAPFSERETRAIRDYLYRIQNQLKVFISLHSYGQLWLTPYGYRSTRPTHYRTLSNLAQLVVTAMNQVEKRKYRAGSIHERLYHVSGSSVDWVYDVLGVKYAYAVELRDDGQYGFLLPRNQIIPTAKELLAAFQVIVKFLNKKQ